MSDVTKLVVIVVFMGSMAFMAGMLGTEIIASSDYEADYTPNSTVIGYGYENIPAPPVCTEFASNFIPFLGDLIDFVACVGSYMAWMISLMFVQTTTEWLNVFFFLPLMVALGFIIIRLARGTG